MAILKCKMCGGSMEIAGIKLGCGIGFNVAYLDVSYDIGLANVGQDAFDDTHTGCLTINLGVNF